MGRRHNPLGFTESALAAGENVDVADGALHTRPGSSIMSSGSLPAGEVLALKNVRFPTNEVSYLVAQVKAQDIRKLILNFNGDYSDELGRHTPVLLPDGPIFWSYGWAFDAASAYSGSYGWKFARRIIPMRGQEYDFNSR